MVILHAAAGLAVAGLAVLLRQLSPPAAGGACAPCAPCEGWPGWVLVAAFCGGVALTSGLVLAGACLGALASAWLRALRPGPAGSRLAVGSRLALY